MFKTLSSEHRRRAIKNIAASVVLAILEVFSLTAIIPILSELTGQGEKSKFITLNIGSSFTLPWLTALTIIVLIFLIKNIAGFFVLQDQSNFISDAYAKYSQQLYQHFYHQPWIEYTKENSAETIRKIKNTPFDFTNYVLQSFLHLTSDAIVCVLMIGVMIWVDYRIIIFLIGLCLPVILFYHLIRKKVITKIDKSFRELVPMANVMLTQGIDSYAEARIYKKENFFIDQFMRINQTTIQQLARLKIYTGLPSKIFETLGILCFASIIYFSKTFPVYSYNVAVFIGLLSLALYRIVPAFNRMLISVSQIQTYAYSISELQKSLDKERSRLVIVDDAISFEKAISIKNLSFQYDGNSKLSLLKNLNVEICKGEFILLQGPSGVGKTTLIHILAGLINEYQGEFKIDEKILAKETLLSWQNKLGFVPQATVVLQGTLLENISYGQTKEEIDLIQVQRAIELAGLKDFAESLSEKLNTDNFPKWYRPGESRYIFQPVFSVLSAIKNG
jgi:ABC-type multidrug transport system fused ATPase/permease subunit